MYALSLKQPWATLLAHGLKTIEVRRWPTGRRGRILIHAARIPDERPEAWDLVPPELLEVAQLAGGILGAGDLIDCKPYRDRDAFLADQLAHLNRPSWYEPGLFGFTFVNAAPLPFHRYPGWMRFFPVDAGAEAGDPSKRAAKSPRRGSARRRAPKRPRQPEAGRAVAPSLLVSVRSVEEAEAALAGGAGLIDVKEPGRGSLGQAPDEVLRAVIETVAARRPVSAALGELLEARPVCGPIALDFAKWGLSGCGGRTDWPGVWRAAAEQLGAAAPDCRPVAVAYADWQRANAPPPEVVATFARLNHCGAFLLDTWLKDGKTLLDWLSLDELARLSRTCRHAGVPVALAGSLGATEIATLRDVRPDWFAVRGSVCRGGRREATIDPAAVRRLADLLASFTTPAANRGD